MFFLFFLMQDIEEWLEIFLDWVNKFGIGITVFCAMVVIIFRIKNDIGYKTIRAFGKGKLMDLLLKLNNILEKMGMSMESADKFLDKMQGEYLLKMDMEEGIMDLQALLSMKKTLSQPGVNEVLQEYKKKSKYGVIKNKKRWNEIRKDPKVDEALEAILDSLVSNIKLKAMASKEKVKGTLTQINLLIKAIGSDENILRNREKRKEIETYSEELRAQEKEIDLKKVKEKLFNIFMGVTRK